MSAPFSSEEIWRNDVPMILYLKNRLRTNQNPIKETALPSSICVASAQ